VLRDEAAQRPIVQRTVPFEGAIFDVVRDRVDLGDAGIVTRDCVRHPGAVAILAIDDDGRVALIDQYRHCVRSVLWEIPAGLLDHVDEDPLEAAMRELAEEADLRAARWDVLVDYLASPGFSDEAIRVFLARDLTEVPQEQRYTRGEEESSFTLRWVPLDDVAAAVVSGDMASPTLALATLTAVYSRAAGWATLRPSNAPWKNRPRSQPT
jgi:ADP-ribose pyrophosphatase